jgi:hypothetical protein
MNRYAAVLAADSATTVSQWNGTEREVRYFKGANKIHSLSDYAPVGFMIFAGADILNVPWEVIVKAFRQSLGDKTFNTMDGYAEEFFSFLGSETRFFPLDVQKDNALSAAKRLAYRISLDVRSQCPEGASRDEWTAKFDAEILRLRGSLEEQPLSSDLDPEWVEKNIIIWVPELAEIIDKYLNIPDQEPRSTDFIALSELALWTLLKNSEDHLGSTGLVIAGYGDHDIFPSYVQYICSGLIGGKCLFREESRKAIDHERAADLSAFAQTGMIDTFQLGLDSSVFADANLSFVEAVRGFADEVVQESGGNLASIGDLDRMVSRARSSFSTDWLKKTRDKHAQPLRRVLAALPIREMAELAETLVNLQSLKEKVTKPSEEVGGPIDVAVITKAEGLVWIRRKHFFDPALNARYMARLGGLYR